jgi:hypothetical protein
LIEHVGFAVTGSLYSLSGSASRPLIALRWRRQLLGS